MTAGKSYGAVLVGAVVALSALVWVVHSHVNPGPSGIVHGSGPTAGARSTDTSMAQQGRHDAPVGMGATTGSEGRNEATPAVRDPSDATARTAEPGVPVKAAAGAPPVRTDSTQQGSVVVAAATATVQTPATASGTHPTAHAGSYATAADLPTPRTLRDSASALLAQGHDKEAIALLLEWGAVHGTDTSALLELARAQGRVGDYEASARSFAIVTRLDSSVALKLEAADILLLSGDTVRSRAMLLQAAAQRPADSDTRLRLARALAWSGAPDDALMMYGDVLAVDPRRLEALSERARLYFSVGAEHEARSDLLAVVEQRPDAESLRMLGDLARWSGNLVEARRRYAAADSLLRHHPGHAGSQAAEWGALLALSQDAQRSAERARLGLPFEPAPLATTSRVSATSDNEGYALREFEVTHAIHSGSRGSTAVTAAAEFRSADMSPGAPVRALSGYGVSVGGVAYAGPLRFGAEGGVLTHNDRDAFARGKLSARALVGNVRASLTMERLPAYESLWAPALVLADATDSRRLAASTLGSLVVDAPWQKGDLYLSASHLNVPGRNGRTSLAAAVRRSLFGAVSLHASAGYLSAEKQTADYFSPAKYTSASLGVGYARYRGSGLSLAVRLLPGYARLSDVNYDAFGTVTGGVEKSFFQFSGSGELLYSTGGWDIGAAAALGSGRGEGYRSSTIALLFKRSW